MGGKGRGYSKKKPKEKKKEQEREGAVERNEREKMYVKERGCEERGGEYGD